LLGRQAKVSIMAAQTASRTSFMEKMDTVGASEGLRDQLRDSERAITERQKDEPSRRMRQVRQERDRLVPTGDREASQNPPGADLLVVERHRTTRSRSRRGSALLRQLALTTARRADERGLACRIPSFY
jgi:hypothetical protein